MTPAEMETYVGTYVNGLLKIELFVRDWKLFRKDFYPPTAEEGPGRAFEVPVEKVGTSLAFLSIIFDHYDRRGNEERYRLFLKWTTRIGFGVAGCAYALDFLTL